MASNNPSGKVGPDKLTGFTFKGNEVVLSKTLGRPLTRKHWRKGFYTDQERIRVATLYAVTGSMTRVSELTGVPTYTIKSWTRQEWFRTLLDDIRAENDAKIEAIQNEIIFKSAELIRERLENGDPHVTRDGEIIYKPVSYRDLNIGQAIGIDKREILRNRPKEQAKEQAVKSINEKLDDLAKSFKRIAARPPGEGEVVDAEVIDVTPKN